MSMELDDDVTLDDPSTEAPPPAAIDKRQTAVLAQDITRVQSQLTEFDRVAAGLAAIEERYPLDAVYDVSTTKGLDAAKEHRAAYRDPRIAVEKARKSAKAPLIELGKNIETRAAWITARLVAGEEPVHAQIKAEEARREQEKQDRINAEAGRVLAIQEALAGIGQDVLAACGKTSADIRALIERMSATHPDPAIFQEMIDQARIAWSTGVAKLEMTLKAKLWDEAETKRIADERAAEAARRVEEEGRLARVAAEQAEAAKLLAQQRAQLERERAELEALRAAVAPPPVPAPAPQPAPAPVEPVVQDPPRVFDRAADVTPTNAELDAEVDESARVLREDAELEARFGPLETAEGDAQPAAPAVVLAALANALPTHRVEALGDPLLLAEVRSFVTHVMEAFETKFPKQPKPSVDWWASTRQLGAELQQRITDSQSSR